MASAGNGCSSSWHVQVFNGSRSTRTEEVIANSVLQQEWRRLQGDQGAEGAAVEPSESSKPIEGDCPICYDSLEPEGTTAQVRCIQSRTTTFLWPFLQTGLLSGAAIAFPLISIGLGTSSLTIGGDLWVVSMLLALLLLCLWQSSRKQKVARPTLRQGLSSVACCRQGWCHAASARTMYTRAALRSGES